MARKRRRPEPDPLEKAFLQALRQVMQLPDEEVRKQLHGFSRKVAFTHQEVTVKRLGRSAMARVEMSIKLTQKVPPREALLADVRRANATAVAYAWIWNPDSSHVEVCSTFHLHAEGLPRVVEPAAFAAAIQGIDGEAMHLDFWPSLTLQETAAPWRKRPDLYDTLVALERAPAKLAAVCPEGLDELLLADADQAAAELLALGFEPRVDRAGLQLPLPVQSGSLGGSAHLTMRVEEDARLGGVVVDELMLEPGLLLGDAALNELNLANLRTSFPCHGNGAWVQEDGMLLHRNRLPGAFHQPGQTLGAAAGAAARVEVAARWLDRMNMNV